MNTKILFISASILTVCALAAFLFNPDLAASALSVASVLAILAQDYKSKTRPLPSRLANSRVIQFQGETESLRLAA